MPLSKSEDVGLSEDRGINQGESSIFSACSREHTKIVPCDHRHAHPHSHVSYLSTWE